jgi:lipoprotein-releasing system permease protein
MLGVMVGSAALIIILSVFNGFEEVVLKMFNSFTPQIVVSPAEGKTFNPNTQYFEQLKKDHSIYSFTEVLAQNVLVRYNEKQTPALVKGVSNDFLKNNSLDSVTMDGVFILHNKIGQPQAVVGSALQALLGVNPADPFEQLQIFSPKKGATGNTVNPLDDFTTLSISPAGVFQVQQDYDGQLIVPLSFARELLGEPINVSAIEINVKPNIDAEKLKLNIAQQLGAKYVVKNRIEQNQALYNLLGSEKWMVYIILTFILIIAIFNIIGSLTMLVIDKQKDISVLISLGAGKRLIKRIFLAEGMMITITGCIFGILIGFIFCQLQKTYGMIKMGGEADFVVSNAYPVALNWKDFILVFITVSFFSFIAAGLASNLSVKKTDHINQDL